MERTVDPVPASCFLGLELRRGTDMEGKQDDQEEKRQDQSPSAPTGSPVPCREVVVTHVDSPPRSGKQQIHPRRPAPIVPNREPDTGDQTDTDTYHEDSSPG